MSAKNRKWEDILASSQGSRRSNRIKAEKWKASNISAAESRSSPSAAESRNPSVAELRSPISQLFFPPVQFSSRTQYMEHLKAAHKIVEEAENVCECKENYSPFDEHIQKLYDMYVDLSNPPKTLRARDSAEASTMLIEIRSRAMELSRRKSEVLKIERSEQTAPTEPTESSNSKQPKGQSPEPNAEGMKLLQRDVAARSSAPSAATFSHLDAVPFEACDSIDQIEARVLPNGNLGRKFQRPSSSGILEYRTPRRRNTRLFPSVAGRPNHYSLFSVSKFGHQNRSTNLLSAKQPEAFDGQRRSASWCHFGGYNHC